MLTIYAQAAPDARPRPSDRTLSSGERLQFIGSRATRNHARQLAQRESIRVQGVACVLDTMGWQVIALYRGGALDCTTSSEQLAVSHVDTREARNG